MRGLMMDRPLLLSALLIHAEAVFPDSPVVSREIDGSILRTDWRRIASGARRLANALEGLGIVRGDRIGTIAWNNRRHLEIYFAVPSAGAVCHTVNPRLAPAELVYVLNHAEDRVVFVDTTFLPLAEAVAGKLPKVEHWVVMTSREGMPPTRLPNAVSYDELLEAHDDEFTWPEMDEHTASALCYTSGTTGEPKGVLFSHRSTVLHSWAVAMPGVLGGGEDDVILPVVPMFHANAWGIPYMCAITGAGLALPGAGLDGANLTGLMNEAGVTLALGVPTIWHGLLQHWRASGDSVPSLHTVGCGGSAPPASMISAFEDDLGIEFRQGWGMTEMNPVGSINALRTRDRELPVDERLNLQMGQGRPLFGVECRVVGEDGVEVPRDGQSVGELQVRGPWVCAAYYKEDVSAAHGRDGWFATGDVVSMDELGSIRITDRKKDLIKSGGEWISSIDLENTATGHPDISQAAVIAIPDDRWGERPLLVVVPREGVTPSPDSVRSWLTGKVLGWWIPEQVVVRDALPIGATGKVQKNLLRKWWAETSAAGGAEGGEEIRA